ncbi:MAG: flagellar biosynthesis protein FlhB [Gammaproteobacteria bacterium]|nr:MAG: flagellar biosynthesis protein FlhB [Gammaproteobacteria bacterium]
MSETDQALALFYNGKTAPRLTGRGEDALAREIVEIARAHGVPIYEDEALVKSLMHLKLGDEIPAGLYRAIAEVIAFAWVLKGRQPEGWTPPQSET